MCLCFTIVAEAQDFTSRSVQVDPGFAYYQDRTPESVAAELKVNGHGWGRYIVLPDSAETHVGFRRQQHHHGRLQ